MANTNKYFVYIGTENERGCPKYDSLDEALQKYNETEMKTMNDSVFLGIEGDSKVDGYYCFDIVHKFFEDNILINDYLNHKEAEDIMEIAQGIIDKLFIRYQWVYDILKGVLIDYESPFAKFERKEEIKIDAEWNEVYLSTCTNGEMQAIGWILPTKESYEKYGWNYPKTTSYVSLMNITMHDEKEYRHYVDIDPREYLRLLDKKVSIKEV